MQDLTIALVQCNVHWHEIEANLAMFEEKIWQIDQSVDLIILPEMFNTGFTMEAEKLAEPMGGKTFKWLKQQAAQTKAVVTGSYIVKQDGQYFNRLIWMDPNGSGLLYDKRHLFRMAEEHHYFTPGNSLLVTELKGWKLCPLICYDLRFPSWSRNLDPDDGGFRYDLLLYVANWPAARVSAWDILLRARAVENLSYSVGLNRIGPDGLGIDYCGHSAVIDFKGSALAELGEDEAIKVVTLAPSSLTKYRQKFPAHLDADPIKFLNS